MPSRDRRIDSLTGAAAILGIHRNTLAGWIRQGCPTLTEADRDRGIDWEISVADVVDWRISRAVEDALSGMDDGDGRVSREEADRRRAVAQAITAEVDADQALDLVVGRTEAETDIAAFCTALRAGLSNAAAKIAARASAMTSAPEIQELVLAEINRAFDTAVADLARQWPETLHDPAGTGHGGDPAPHAPDRS